MKKSLSVLTCKALVLTFAGLFTSYSPFAFAAYASKDSVQGYIILIIGFINNILLPLIFSIALLFFLINAARYFILKGDSDADREKAKTLALYGIGAFVILVSIWGIVNMFVNGLGITDDRAICPDFLGDWCFSNYGDSADSFSSDEIWLNFEINGSL